MGYPVEGTTLDSFIRKINNLHTYGIKSSGKIQKYYYRYVEEILSHPVLRFKPESDRSQKFSLFFTNNEITAYYNLHSTDLIFKELHDAKSVFTYVIELVEYLQSITSSDKNKNRLYELSLQTLVAELRSLQDLLTNYWDEIDISTSWQLVIETIRSIRIPLSGEPVKGIQIMGFLETRALDFENVIILSMNENAMPGNKSGNSYIPYALRKVFNIPSNDDREAAISFHFHRLLQRSKKVTLLYDSSPGNKSGGEESRYLLQLKHELGIQSNGKTKINNKYVKFDIPSDKTGTISISNSNEIIEHLHQRFTKNKGKIKYMSPSALSTYINCTLQFYFKYVLELFKNDDPEKNIDQKLFGTLLHEVMKELYLPYNKSIINEETLDRIKTTIPNTINSVLVQHLNLNKSQLEGYNLLQVGAIEILVNRIIDKDREYLPIEIVSLEEEYVHQFSTREININIGGKFDRVDKVNGITRIVDYKTGTVTLTSPENLEKIFSDPKKKEMFQVYLYKSIYDKINSDDDSVAGFYTLRSIASGFTEPKKSNFKVSEVMPEFNEKLSDLIYKIFDPAEIFTKTPIEENCKFCDFKDICNR